MNRGWITGIGSSVANSYSDDELLFDEARDLYVEQGPRHEMCCDLPWCETEVHT